MASIEQLLHRRTDLSTFLVHLTRDNSTAAARENLLSIADQLTIEARTLLGPAAHLEPYLAGTMATQKVVCFTETPLEHTSMMLEDIEGRSLRFAPYRVVLPRRPHACVTAIRCGTRTSAPEAAGLADRGSQ